MIMEFERFDRWLNFLEERGWIKTEGKGVELCDKFLVELSDAISLAINESKASNAEELRKAAMAILALKALERGTAKQIAELATVLSAIVKTFWAEERKGNIVKQIISKGKRWENAESLQ